MIRKHSYARATLRQAQGDPRVFVILSLSKDAREGSRILGSGSNEGLTRISHSLFENALLLTPHFVLLFSPLNKQDGSFITPDQSAQ